VGEGEGRGGGGGVTEDVKIKANDKSFKQARYELETMTPDDVHYGSVPESVVNEENENIRRMLSAESGNCDEDIIWGQVRTCNNAMKQYKRSRPEPSREGIRRR